MVKIVDEHIIRIDVLCKVSQHLNQMIINTITVLPTSVDRRILTGLGRRGEGRTIQIHLSVSPPSPSQPQLILVNTHLISTGPCNMVALPLITVVV